MLRRLKELAILVAILAIGGAIVIAIGVVPTRASDGHWALTRWLLDFASDRSVAFHSRNIEAPRLDDPGLIRLGAATYESNCRWCHGWPGQVTQPVAGGMTPKPPYLADAAKSHDAEELFYIVKHGIKFAGMPAWPTQGRDDEVWPVVAFLRQLPNLDAQQYQSLVSVAPPEMLNADAAEAERQVVNRCDACHGQNDASSIVPSLSGQSEEYLRLSLEAYKRGERHSGIMQPQAARLTETEIQAAASYYASRKPMPWNSSIRTEADSDAWQLGEQLARAGSQADKIPSCVDCHGPGENVRSDDYPRLAGQPARYLERRLELFHIRHRGGSENASLMHPIAGKLDPHQRAALAEYYGHPTFTPASGLQP